LQIPAVPFGPNHGFETIKWPQVSGCRHNLAASASGFCAERSVDCFEEKSIANKRSFHQQSLKQIRGNLAEGAQAIAVP
jgi:hypothetical protein